MDNLKKLIKQSAKATKRLGKLTGEIRSLAKTPEDKIIANKALNCIREGNLDKMIAMMGDVQRIAGMERNLDIKTFENLKNVVTDHK